MNDQELKMAIADTLHRNYQIMLQERARRYGPDEGPDITGAEITDMLNAAAGNLATTIPELLMSAGDKIRRADYVEMRNELARCKAEKAAGLVTLNDMLTEATHKIRAKEREECAAMLDSLADEISEESASNAQQLRAAAGMLRRRA